MALKILIFTYGCISHLPASRPAIRPGCVRRRSVGGKMEEAKVFQKTVQRSSPEKTQTPQQSTEQVYKESWCPVDITVVKGTISGWCHLFGALHRHHCVSFTLNLHSVKSCSQKTSWKDRHSAMIAIELSYKLGRKNIFIYGVN